MNPCTYCNGTEWTLAYSDEYDGHKGSDDRDETEREVYKCDNCGREGRKFTDGVDGSVTFAGALRPEGITGQ